MATLIGANRLPLLLQVLAARPAATPVPVVTSGPAAEDPDGP